MGRSAKRGLPLNVRRLPKRGGFRGRVGTAAELRQSQTGQIARGKSRAADLAPVIEDIRTAVANSLRSIVSGLNERGISAPRGGVWSSAQVRAVFTEDLNTYLNKEYSFIKRPAA